jgi:soluble lytic murein transglycosylase
MYRAQVAAGKLSHAVQTLKSNPSVLSPTDGALGVSAIHKDFVTKALALKPTGADDAVAAAAVAAAVEEFARFYPINPAAEAAFAGLRARGFSQAALIRKLWPSPQGRRAHALEIFRRLGNEGPHRAFALSLGGLSGTLTRKRQDDPERLSMEQKEALLEDAEWFMGVREYDHALSVLEELSSSKTFSSKFTPDKLMFLHARSANASSNPRFAAKRYQELFSQFPQSQFASQARRNYLLSLHFSRRHEAVISEMPKIVASNSSLQKSTRWLNYWSHYLAVLRSPASVVGPRAKFEDLVSKKPSYLGQGADLIRQEYWQARVLEREGNIGLSREIFGRIAQSSEQSIYRIFARWRLSRPSGPGESAVAPAIGSLGLLARGIEWTKGGPPSQPDWRPAELRTGVQETDCASAPPAALRFAAVGLDDFAQALFSRFRLGRNDSGRVLECALAAFAAQEYTLASQLGFRAIGGGWKRKDLPYPKKLVGLRSGGSLVFPAAHREVVEAVTAGLLIDPVLVYAVMKAESNFRPQATSNVGAKGLMQIMPQTGYRIASLIGFDAFHPDMLFLPEVNIAFGAWYLNHLYKYYRGDLIRTIAAYNAGPQAVDRWATQSGDLEIDEFAENIPFGQTHGYVRKVLGYMDSYMILRGSGDGETKGFAIGFGPKLELPRPGMEVF